MILQRDKCPNFNHGRPNVPVRFCPQCGEVVNKDIPIQQCNKGKHVPTPGERNTYCVDCGEQLRQER